MLVNLFVAVSRGSVGGFHVVRVEADRLLVAHLVPVRFHQLGLRGHRVERVGVGAHLVVHHVVPLHAHGPHHVLALLLGPQFESLTAVLLIALGLKSGHADLGGLLNVLDSALLSVRGTRGVGNRGVVGSHWGSMVLVVDEGRLGNMVDRCHRSCVVDLLVVVVVGGDRGGGNDSRLVAGMMMAVADTGERASNAMSGVEVALRADQAGQIGADKQNRLQKKLKMTSRNPRYQRQAGQWTYCKKLQSKRYITDKPDDGTWLSQFKAEQTEQRGRGAEFKLL